jgi:hypothetical protein
MNVMLKAFATFFVILVFTPRAFAQAGGEHAITSPTGTGIIRGTVVDTRVGLIGCRHG